MRHDDFQRRKKYELGGKQRGVKKKKKEERRNWIRESKGC